MAQITNPTTIIADEEILEYFESINKEVQKAYEIAQDARALHKDPEQKIDIPIAEDLAARVEGLVATIFPNLTNSGLKEGIRVLEAQFGKNDERVALKIAGQVAEGKFIKFERESALGAGVRVGVAYLTLGLVTAPLEGISNVKIKDNYAAIYFAGPIRSAGGTAAALSVLVTDYVRRVLGIGAFKANQVEIKRYVTEINDYHRFQNLQYLPSEAEIALIIEHLPVCVDGDPTEKQEVSTHKDLDRVETNRIRGGMALVIAEALAGKAPKILAKLRQWASELGLEDWNWLSELVALQKSRADAKLKIPAQSSGQARLMYIPSEKYVSRVIAGRPVFAHPGKVGSFRLRYGRARTCGLAATAINPATAYLLEFAAIGTQLAMEMPGKATICTTCDTLEPPIVKLKSGEVIELKTKEEVAKYTDSVEMILHLGDVLIPFGEFVSNGHMLLPAGFCEEWWAAEVRAEAERKGENIEKINDYLKSPWPAPPFDLAVSISKSFSVPLHPRYNYFWHDISKDDLKTLIDWFASAEKIGDKIYLKNGEQKNILENLCIPHSVENDKIVIQNTIPIYFLLGCPTEDKKTELLNKVDKAENVLDAVSALAGVKIIARAPTRIGMKMGRPEKAERRLMEGRPQILFPCGSEGGRLRNLITAYEKGKISAEFPFWKCKKCGGIGHFPKCECGGEAEYTTFNKISLDIKPLMNKAAYNLGLEKLPVLMKGVRGVSSARRYVEPLEKGMLRAKYDLYVNKDGTTRYDATNAGLTHFKPSEIEVSIEKLRALGYTHDVEGKHLENEEQLCELKPQDIIISDNADFSSADYFIKITKFVDELLVKFYSSEPFYNVKTKEDLVGHLVIGLAPHTSAGIVGRIIGFTKAKVIWAHPFWHAAKRRNLDGDEDSIMLLTDALLNFSRQYLPATRGASTMDAPLVLTSRLDPQEVDNEVWNIEAQSSYPLEFYYDTLNYKFPWELSKKITLVSNLIAKAEVFHIPITHSSSGIESGPLKSKYVRLKSMDEKVTAQLELARRIRAVDADKVAEAVLEKHFIRDVRGNLRTFLEQQVRCTDCNAKYRRVPLSGKCNCGGALLLTVSEGTIRKYLEPSKKIVEKFKISPYLAQQFVLIEADIDGIFGKKARQLGLAKFT